MEALLLFTVCLLVFSTSLAPLAIFILSILVLILFSVRPARLGLVGFLVALIGPFGLFKGRRRGSLHLVVRHGSSRPILACRHRRLRVGGRGRGFRVGRGRGFRVGRGRGFGSEGFARGRLGSEGRRFGRGSASGSEGRAALFAELGPRASFVAARCTEDHNRRGFCNRRERAMRNRNAKNVTARLGSCQCFQRRKGVHRRLLSGMQAYRVSQRGFSSRFTNHRRATIKHPRRYDRAAKVMYITLVWTRRGNSLGTCNARKTSSPENTNQPGLQQAADIGH